MSTEAEHRAALDGLAGSLRERMLAQPAEPGTADDAQERIRSFVDREASVLDQGSRDALVARIAERSFGLGPLEPLLADPEVDEVLVCGTAPAWVERRGRLEATEVRFASDGELRHAIERILAPLGRRVDEAEPLCDARLPDGSRVNVVIPPLALDGPVLTIRRFRSRGFTPDELVANGTLTAPLAELLARAVRRRCNLLVCGGTGSGKTTLLNALSSFIDPGERVVTIEDAAELRLRQPHVLRLEARPPNLEGRGEVTIRRLVKNALRMRPDRIVVGEVRGPEALDMLTALATGHDGSLCTVHAGSAAEALRRLETLALMADVGLPHAAIREQVADAIDLVVCQARARGRQPPGDRRGRGRAGGRRRCGEGDLLAAERTGHVARAAGGGDGGEAGRRRRGMNGWHGGCGGGMTRRRRCSRRRPPAPAGCWVGGRCSRPPRRSGSPSGWRLRSRRSAGRGGRGWRRAGWSGAGSAGWRRARCSPPGGCSAARCSGSSRR